MSVLRLRMNAASGDCWEDGAACGGCGGWGGEAARGREATFALLDGKLEDFVLPGSAAEELLETVDPFRKRVDPGFPGSRPELGRFCGDEALGGSGALEWYLAAPED